MTRLNDIKLLGLWLIKSLRSPLSFYVVLKRDFLKITNLANGKVEESNNLNFSSRRLLIADPIKAEEAAKTLLERISSKADLGTRTKRILCHPIDNEFSEMSPAERMILNDFAHQIGGSYVKIIDANDELTQNEIKNYT